MIALFLLYDLCRKMLTLRSAVCTVGAVINEQEQEMKEANKYDAPEGYVAVEPKYMVYSCYDCALYLGDDCGCTITRCVASNREDRQRVIFIKKNEGAQMIDEKDAPEGYVACTPIPDVLGYNSCIGCAFNDEHTNGCVPSRGKSKC